MSLHVKRVYAPADLSDGVRLLVDRLWPRGISREKARIDEWMKEIAPSTVLRAWAHHHVDRWEEFVERYRGELNSPDKKALLDRVRAMSRKGTVTLLFASRNEDHNNAIALLGILKQKDR